MSIILTVLIVWGLLGIISALFYLLLCWRYNEFDNDDLKITITAFALGAISFIFVLMTVWNMIKDCIKNR